MFPLVRLGLLGLLAGAALVLALERDAPLFLNLGPGDERFARGFRSGWERDGLQGSGETLFRWSEDGARVELPVSLTGPRDLRLRLRIARFLDKPAEIRLLAGDRLADRWTQEPRGWTVRNVDLSGASGPLRLQIRSTAADPREPLGVALDWVEVLGAGRILPRSLLLPGLLALFVGVPLVVAWGLGRTAGAAGGVLLLAAGACAVGLDRLGGLVALSEAGFPALACSLLLLLVSRLLLRGRALAAPVGLAVGVSSLAILALSHPGYYYPDVDTHARYLQAMRRDPALAWDPADYQARTGAWTREIAGRKVAFPYSPAFHLLAWPLALVLGETAAVKTLAALALGSSLLLVYVLAGAVGLPPPVALAAPALLALLPVTSSRLALALFPTLLGQAVELLLVVAVATRERMRVGPLLAILFLAQAAYTASFFNVAAFVCMAALLWAAAGERAAAARLLVAWAVAALLVAVILYGRFLPSFARNVLPHVAEAAVSEGPSAPPLVSAGRRLALFYDALYPVLTLLGLFAWRGAPDGARRAVHALLLGGLGLLLLRYLLPTVFRDAKEIEMLAPAVALASAAGLAWLVGQGVVGRLLAALAVGCASVWGVQQAAAVYAERFVAVAR